jgi:hypothetical protein
MGNGIDAKVLPSRDGVYHQVPQIPAAKPAPERPEPVPSMDTEIGRPGRATCAWLGQLALPPGRAEAAGGTGGSWES